jgi:hypothetical protein
VLICISLYDVKGSPKAAASDWTAKHSTVLGDLIGGLRAKDLVEQPPIDLTIGATKTLGFTMTRRSRVMVEPRRIELLTS